MGATVPPFVLLLSPLLCSGALQAGDPPPCIYMYRSDYCTPASIFAAGFQALGDNKSLEDHGSGSSCRTGTSTTAFVATTSKEEFAISWGQGSFTLEQQNFYVYKMRATENFYSAEASLDLHEAYHRTGESKYAVLADHYVYQKEWLAVGGEPSSHIEMAEIYSTPDKSENVAYTSSLRTQSKLQ